MLGYSKTRVLLFEITASLTVTAGGLVGALILNSNAHAEPPMRSQRLRSWKDTEGKVLGNPDNALSDFRALYPVFQIYQRRHSGRYPQDLWALLGDARKNPVEYPGFSVDLMTNPDSDLSRPRRPEFQASIGIPYVYEPLRPNGTAVGGPKKPGTRDVLLYTGLYYRRNFHRGGPMKPVGWWIVLWDDGKAEKLPFDKVLFLVRTDGKKTIGFPGQAGMVAKAKPYWDFYQNHKVERPPLDP
jgi:hypothetical protein